MFELCGCVDVWMWMGGFFCRCACGFVCADIERNGLLSSHVMALDKDMMKLQHSIARNASLLECIRACMNLFVHTPMSFSRKNIMYTLFK